jgi:hypothetical protein
MKIIKIAFCAIVAILALTVNIDNVTTNHGIKDLIGAKAFADPPPPIKYDRSCSSISITCTRTVTNTGGGSIGGSVGGPGGSVNGGVSGSTSGTTTESYTFNGNRCTCTQSSTGTFTHCTACTSSCDTADPSCPRPTVTVGS